MGTYREVLPEAKFSGQEDVREFLQRERRAPAWVQDYHLDF